MLVPFIATVPPALVVTELAVTAALKVVASVELTVKSPNEPLLAPPTTPVNVTAAVPAEIVNVRNMLEILFTVLEKITAALVVEAETLLFSTTGPV